MSEHKKVGGPSHHTHARTLATSHKKENPQSTDHSERSKSDDRRESSSRAIWGIDYDSWMIFLTGVLAVATIVLAIYTYLLWAEATETSHKQLRAYVSLSGINFLDVTDQYRGKPVKGRFFVITADFKNNGQTPASNFNGELSYLFDSWPGKPEFKSVGDSPPSQVMLGAGQVTNITIPPFFIADGDVKKLNNGSLVVYAYGKVTYKDIFHESHFVKFRFMRGGNRMIAATLMAACEDGNESD